MLKTKIICTLGPATDDEAVLRQLMKGGMNVARMNFSHGTYDEHTKRIEMFKRIRKEFHFPIALMLDTKGPEVRIKKFEYGQIELVEGQKFTLTSRDVVGDNRVVAVTYEHLAQDLHTGCSILIDDGLIDLYIDRIEQDDIHCTVVTGGILSNNKSINIPCVKIRLPYVSEQDKADLLFGIENDFDFVAASFVRTRKDVAAIRALLEENNGKLINIVAKIENQEGVDNIDEIIDASDGIMVARGDMGVEIPFENIPFIQKTLIKKCYSAGKRVIVATQMLDSMMRNPRPTRAEATDVANAIYDGTSAIMLSGETAAGKYPIESLATMVKIAIKTESEIHYQKRFEENRFPMRNITDAISHATCSTAHDLNAAAIITVTKSGHTARMVSKFRPDCPIIAAAIEPIVWRQLALSWGVYPVMADVKTSTDELFDHAIEQSMATGLIKTGDIIVITGGVPLGVSGTTNILKVQVVESKLGDTEQVLA
ncbi:MAG: pyruvate kinase [Clostridiales bacterium]|nr:pyruvate kinase [Clostridiales bacterium]